MKLTMKPGGINTISKSSRFMPLAQLLLVSDVRISDRLDEIDKWRKTLEYTIQDVDREIQAIQSAKEQCERYLEHMRSPLGKKILFNQILKKTELRTYSDVSLENYVTRNGRKAIDNVDDEAERELKKVRINPLYRLTYD